MISPGHSRSDSPVAITMFIPNWEHLMDIESQLLVVSKYLAPILIPSLVIGGGLREIWRHLSSGVQYELMLIQARVPHS